MLARYHMERFTRRSVSLAPRHRMALTAAVAPRLGAATPRARALAPPGGRYAGSRSRGPEPALPDPGLSRPGRMPYPEGGRRHPRSDPGHAAATASGVRRRALSRPLGAASMMLDARRRRRLPATPCLPGRLARVDTVVEGRHHSAWCRTRPTLPPDGGARASREVIEQVVAPRSQIVVDAPPRWPGDPPASIAVTISTARGGVPRWRESPPPVGSWSSADLGQDGRCRVGR